MVSPEHCQLVPIFLQTYSCSGIHPSAAAAKHQADKLQMYMEACKKEQQELRFEMASLSQAVERGKLDTTEMQAVFVPTASRTELPQTFRVLTAVSLVRQVRPAGHGTCALCYAPVIQLSVCRQLPPH